MEVSSEAALEHQCLESYLDSYYSYSSISLSPHERQLGFLPNNPLLSRAVRSNVIGPPSNCDDNVTQAAGSEVGLLCRREYM